MTRRKFHTSAELILDRGLYLTRLPGPPVTPSNTGSTCTTGTAARVPVVLMMGGMMMRRGDGCCAVLMCVPVVLCMQCHDVISHCTCACLHQPPHLLPHQPPHATPPTPHATPPSIPSPTNHHPLYTPGLWSLRCPVIHALRVVSCLRRGRTLRTRQHSPCPSS